MSRKGIELGISIPMTVNRKNGLIGKLNTDAGTSCHLEGLRLHRRQSRPTELPELLPLSEQQHGIRATNGGTRIRSRLHTPRPLNPQGPPPPDPRRSARRFPWDQRSAAGRLLPVGGHFAQAVVAAEIHQVEDVFLSSCRLSRSR